MRKGPQPGSDIADSLSTVWRHSWD